MALPVQYVPRVRAADRADAIAILEAMAVEEYKPLNEIVKTSGVRITRVMARIRALGSLVETKLIQPPYYGRSDKRIYGYRRRQDAIERVRRA